MTSPSRHLCFFGLDLTFSAEDPDLLEELVTSVPGGPHLPPSHTCTCDARVRVHARAGADGWHVDVERRSGPASSHVYATMPNLLEGVEQIVTEAGIESARDRGRVPLHAAGAVSGSGAVLALGNSGSGKSNIAFAWMRTGAELLGDDVVYVTPDLDAEPFVRHFKLEVERARTFGIEPDRTPGYDPECSEVWAHPTDLGGRVATTPARIRRVIHLVFDPDAPERIERMGELELLDALLRSRIGEERVGAEEFDLLHALARAAEGYRVITSDTSAVAPRLLGPLEASTDASTPRVRADVVFRTVGTDWVAYDPAANEMHVLNLTSALIWELCDGDTTVSRIVELLGEVLENAPAPAELRVHVDEALAAFAERGLLE